jgi:hypothetical protein
MEGQQKTALAAVLVNKSRLPRKKTPREKAKNAKKHMTDKGGFGLFHAKFIKQHLFISV